MKAAQGALREVGLQRSSRHHPVGGCRHLGLSDLKFQADMGILLTFMFMVNMLMAITVLPAFAVKLDSLFPRRGPVKAPAIGHWIRNHLSEASTDLPWRLPCWALQARRRPRLPKAKPAAAAAFRTAPKLVNPEKAPIYASAVAGKRVVAVGDYGFVILSDDGKRFRQAAAVPTRAPLTSVFFLDVKRGWAAGHDGTILTTADGGDTWQMQREERGKERVLLSIWFENPSHGLAVGPVRPRPGKPATAARPGRSAGWWKARRATAISSRSSPAPAACCSSPARRAASCAPTMPGRPGRPFRPTTRGRSGPASCCPTDPP